MGMWDHSPSGAMPHSNGRRGDFLEGEGINLHIAPHPADRCKTINPARHIIRMVNGKRVKFPYCARPIFDLGDDRAAMLRQAARLGRSALTDWKRRVLASYDVALQAFIGAAGPGIAVPPPRPARPAPAAA